MPRYVAFLRGINVGGHRVKMDDLRRLFEDLGFSNVSTFIASGNVIFDSPSEDVPALEDRIEGHLRQALGYGVDTFLRSADELAAVAAYRPFPAAEAGDAGGSLVVIFLKTDVGEEARQALAALHTDTDAFHTNGREVYWQCQTGISQSPVGDLIGKALGGHGPGTMRNANTVRKIAAKYATA